jgi:hypothetical protein
MRALREEGESVHVMLSVGGGGGISLDEPDAANSAPPETVCVEADSELAAAEITESSSAANANIVLSIISPLQALSKHKHLFSFFITTHLYSFSLARNLSTTTG